MHLPQNQNGMCRSSSTWFSTYVFHAHFHYCQMVSLGLQGNWRCSHGILSDPFWVFLTSCQNCWHSVWADCLNVPATKPWVLSQMGSSFSHVLLHGTSLLSCRINPACRSVLIDTATLAVGAPDIPDGWGNEAQSMHYGGLLQRSFVPDCRQICPPTLLNFYRQHERVRYNKQSALSMPSQVVCCNSIRSHLNRQHVTTWYIPWFSQWQAVHFFWLPSLGASPNTSRRKLVIRPYGRNCTTLRYTTRDFTLAS